MSLGDRKPGHTGGTGGRDVPLNGGKRRKMNDLVRALQR